MKTMKMWSLSHSYRTEFHDENGNPTFTDYAELHVPKYWAKHDDAVKYIIDEFSSARKERNGELVLKQESKIDGWYYLEWKEKSMYELSGGEYDIHVMQISGYNEYVVLSKEES